MSAFLDVGSVHSDLQELHSESADRMPCQPRTVELMRKGSSDWMTGGVGRKQVEPVKITRCGYLQRLKSLK